MPGREAVTLWPVVALIPVGRAGGAKPRLSLGPGWKGTCDNAEPADPTPRGDGNGPLNAKQRDLLRNVGFGALRGVGIGCFFGGTLGLGPGVAAAPALGFLSGYLF